MHRTLLKNDDYKNTKRSREVEEDQIQALPTSENDTNDTSASGVIKRWTKEQDNALRSAVEEFGQHNWKFIASQVPGRNHAQCLQRWKKVLKPGLVKGHWSYEEDLCLEKVMSRGCRSWAEVASYIPGRTAKQCRERWRNHLDPSIVKTPFTKEEDEVIQQAYESLGNRWSQISGMLPGRTEEATKARWKALNPNMKINSKPGRPRGIPKTVDNTIAVNHSVPKPHEDDDQSHLCEIPVEVMECTKGTTNEIGSTAGAPIENISITTEANDIASNDAEILTELLRSNSSCLLSFGSGKGLASFMEMPPDELLASGELDEMLQAISLANKETRSILVERDHSYSEQYPPLSKTLSPEYVQRVDDIEKSLLDSKWSLHITSSTISRPSDSSDPVRNALTFDSSDYGLSGMSKSDIEEWFDPDLLKPIAHGSKALKLL